MRNTPAEQGEGVDCQHTRDNASYSRNPEKCNVVPFPTERRGEHILLSWNHGFDRFQVCVVRSDGTDLLLSSSPEYADAREAATCAASGLAIPLVEIPKGKEARS